MTDIKRPNRVKEFREDKTWSIAELSRQSGVAYQTIKKMEQGIPTTRNCRLKVAKALDKKHDVVFPNHK